jgi:transcriptional regulator with XRE-family HTH domain
MELKMRNKSMKDFGNRLAKIRKSRGLTQAELGEKVGVSYRVIAYYEIETDQPPGPLIVDLAGALNVTTDELLGVKPVKQECDPKTSRLMKRLKRITELSPPNQRSIIKHLEALLKEKSLKETSANVK